MKKPAFGRRSSEHPLFKLTGKKRSIFKHKKRFGKNKNIRLPPKK
jgi:hypothetical protein